MACSNLEQIYTELKKQLSSLLISSNKGVNIRQLQKDYRELIGGEIPFKKLGYNTLEHYLYSVPDICRLTSTGSQTFVIPVITDKNKHINELIIRQRTPKTSSRYTPPRRNAGVYIRNPPNVNKKPDNFRFSPNHRELPSTNGYIVQNKQKSCQANNTIKSNILLNNNDSSCDNRVEKINKCDNTLKKINENKEPIEEPCSSNLKTKTNSTVNIYPFLDDESDGSDIDPSYDTFDYKSEGEDFSDHLTKLTVKDDQHCVFFNSPLIDKSHVSRINKKVKEKLTLLIKDYPDGIWCSKLLKLYEQKFMQKLNPFNFGFSSVIQMCEDLPDVFHCIRPNRTDWKIFDVSKPVPDIHTMREFSKYIQSLPMPKTETNSEPPLPEEMMYLQNQYKYPTEVMHPDEIISRQFLLNNEKPGDFLELLVAEVYDPSKFWIQLRGSNTIDALNKLMDEMQTFYKYSAKHLLLNELNICVGLMCAALYNNEYHRAIILKIFDDHTMKIFYCDYGTVSQVQIYKTYLLHRKFSKLPMQAIRARLANIIPKKQNTMWSRDAANCMLELIKEKNLIGYIQSINYEQEILDLIITDTTHPEIDVHVNDVLIEKEFAVLGHEAPICTTSSAIISNVHLYPAFEELENAIYPTITEVITMLKLGHTYETIFHGYFKPKPIDTFTHINLNYSNLNLTDECTLFPNVLSNITEDNQRNNDKNYLEEENINIQLKSDKLLDNMSEKNTETKLNEEKHNENMCRDPSKNSKRYNHPVCKPPPGFKRITSENTSTCNYGNVFRTQSSVPVLPHHNIPIPNLPLVQDYTNLNATKILLLSNPLLYRQIMVNQQREAVLQQVKLIERLQTLQQLQYSQTYVNQFENLKFNHNKEKKLQNNCNYSHSDIVEKQNEICKSDNLESTKDCSSIAHCNEHICERFVIKLNIQDCSFHIVKIDDEYYVTLQDTLTNLLKSNLSWKNWLKSVNQNVSSFPYKLIPLDKYEHVYNQVKRYSIPGIYPVNNLGCNVRFITLNQVICIFEKFGNEKLLPELKSQITNVMKSPDAWQMLTFSD